MSDLDKSAFAPEFLSFPAERRLHKPEMSATHCQHPPTDLPEIVRLLGLPPQIEQCYVQIKDERGWADIQVRSDLQPFAFQGM
ncbi:hypothetical protein [Streptomyces sp. NRRL F-6628]|uniref:hypothetical protein n=2 Tax=Streptomyces TaxID=1883 RepID=UPI00056A821D|nr:hypothetical protein [Streptomyces sp. NRRL F-6628]